MIPSTKDIDFLVVRGLQY